MLRIPAPCVAMSMVVSKRMARLIFTAPQTYTRKCGCPIKRDFLVAKVRVLMIQGLGCVFMGEVLGCGSRGCLGFLF